MGDELRWTKIGAKNHPGFDSEVHLAEKAKIGQYCLSDRQISSVGEYETLELTDEIVLHMIMQLR